jgi:hypothetical protein
MRIERAYGRRGLEIDLPDDAPVTSIEPRFRPGLADERATVEEALCAPIGAIPLCDQVTPDDTVVILSSERTSWSPWPASPT